VSLSQSKYDDGGNITIFATNQRSNLFLLLLKEMVILLTYNYGKEMPLNFIQDQVASLTNQICKTYNITKSSLNKMMEWSEDYTSDPINLDPQLVDYLQSLIDKPQNFKELLEDNQQKLTPSSFDKAIRSFYRAILDKGKDHTGLAFIKVLGAHELGYRKGIPGKAGSFMLIPKEATRKFFGELSPTIQNDETELIFNVPNKHETVNFSYIYHNSKYSTTAPSETRDEYRLYSPYLKELSPDVIVLIIKSSAYSFKMHLFSPTDLEYTVLQKIIQKKKIGKSSSALVSLVDLYVNNIIITDMFNAPNNTIDNQMTIAEAPVGYNVAVRPNPIISGVGDLLPEDMIMGDIEKVILQVTQIKRDYRFRRAVIDAYTTIEGNPVCAITGTSITFGYLTNIQAAHIIPKGYGGFDSITNGIPLSGDLHWAFDRGLFTIMEDYTVSVHPSLLNNELLKNIDRRKIFLPSDERFYPNRDAIRFHNDHIYGKFLNSK
jgi:hypothetical protein